MHVLIYLCTFFLILLYITSIWWPFENNFKMKWLSSINKAFTIIIITKICQSVCGKKRKSSDVYHYLFLIQYWYRDSQNDSVVIQHVPLHCEANKWQFDFPEQMKCGSILTWMHETFVQTDQTMAMPCECVKHLRNDKFHARFSSIFFPNQSQQYHHMEK